jgi:hypothetical protein
LHAVVTKLCKKRRSDRKDLFEDDQSTAFPEDYTEVLNDSSISDADIFTGGKMKNGNSSYSIVAQSARSANASNEQLKAKVLIDAHIDKRGFTCFTVTIINVSARN